MSDLSLRALQLMSPSCIQVEACPCGECCGAFLVKFLEKETGGDYEQMFTWIDGFNAGLHMAEEEEKVKHGQR